VYNVELSFNKSIALPAILRAASVAPSKSPMQILQNVRLQAKDGTFVITASDLETTVQASAEASGDIDICVNAKKLTDVIKALPDGADVKLKVGEKISITSGRSRFSVQKVDTETFPNMEDIGDVSRVPVNGAVLAELFNSVDYAVAKNDVRYYLNGVFLQVKDGQLTLVASDGHRLTKNSVPVGNVQDLSAIIPNSAVSAIKKTLAISEGVTLDVGNRWCRIMTGSETVMCKLIEGKYPDIEKVLTKETKTEIKSYRKDLMDAIKRALIVADDRTNALVATIEADEIEIKAVNGLAEESTEVVELIVSFGVSDERYGFNGKYVLESLQAIDSEQVKISISERDIIMIESCDDSPWLSIVMPMRV
jgi:DNA polymerase-3 subunit beta